MYPNLYYAFKDLFGIEIPFLKVLQTFGFFVALAFLAAAYVLTSELRRREKLGLLHPVPETITVGKPASMGDILINAVIGFILGYKILGFFSATPWRAARLPAVCPGQLHWRHCLWPRPWGIINIIQRKKKALPKPREEKVMVYPHQRVPDFTIMAAVAGLIGAKIFHNLENWGEFVSDPWGSIFSASGLTFYGGLILAAYVIIRYAHKKGINWKHLIDSAGPALMLAYAIGRMGCQFSGDGDWGINNSAYATDAATGKVVKIAPAQYQGRSFKKCGLFYQAVRQPGERAAPQLREAGLSQLAPRLFYCIQLPAQRGERRRSAAGLQRRVLQRFARRRFSHAFI